MTTFFFGLIKVILCITIWLSGQITVFEINGSLTWQTTRPETSSICVPAAFTDSLGNIVRLKSHYGVTFTKDSFTVSKNKGDFFQLLLVNNGKIINSKDNRHFVRRALCKDKDGKMFIIQSRYPMTLPFFARILQKRYTYAVNLESAPISPGTSRPTGYAAENEIFRFTFRRRLTLHSECSSGSGIRKGTD